MNRIRKTLRRIAIIFYEIFNVENDYEFKQNHTSCLVISLYNSNEYIKYTNNDIKSCESKVVVGNKNIKPPYPPKKCISNTVNEVCRWTANSTEITSHCFYRYYSILMGYNISHNPIKDEIVNKLQKNICSNIIGENITVYKTVRHIIYNKSKSVLNFEIGETYYQPIFNSTTYYQGSNLDKFSNFETGLSIYIINIPKGSKVYKIPYSMYPEEYEIILPIGCAFKITDIKDELYIKNGDDVYLRMKGYYMDYIDTPSSVINWEMFKRNVKLHEPCNLKGEVITNMSNGAQQYQDWFTNFKTSSMTFFNSKKIAISEKIKHIISLCNWNNTKSIIKWFGEFCISNLYSFITWLIDLLGRTLLGGIDYVIIPILSGLKLLINKTMIKSKHDGMSSYRSRSRNKLATPRSITRNKLATPRSITRNKLATPRSISRNKLATSRSISRNKLATSRSISRNKLATPRSRLASPKLKRKRITENSDKNSFVLLNIVIDAILSEKLTISTRNALLEFKKKTNITKDDIIKLNDLFELKNSEMEAALGLLDLSSNYKEFDDEYRKLQNNSSSSSSSIKQQPTKKIKRSQ